MTSVGGRAFQVEEQCSESCGPMRCGHVLGQMCFMGMKGQNLGSEVMPDTWAKARSQKTLNAPQRISELGSDPARFVRQIGQPGCPEEEEQEAKGCWRNVQSRMRLVA